ncbi:hypothetical protein Leryth_004181 [Lithospermum erythrorhizon]|nr:hypothetical protein Leryth_004181 [Lithospermum erythrorhizon]
METSLLRVFLQSLCHGTPWNYAVFWKLQKGHDMVLTWEDGYCDMQLFSFGKGIIGEVASSGMPLWLFSDHILPDGYSSSLITQCPDEWLPQFAAGIKTILLIPSIPDGVLQLGSLETVVEDVELVAIVKDMLAAHQELAKNPSPFMLSEETHHLPMISCHVENVMKSNTSMGSSIIENPGIIDYVVSKEDLPSIANHRFRSKKNTLNIGDAEDLIHLNLFEQKNNMRKSPNMNKIDAVTVYGENSSNIIQYYLGGSEPYPIDDYTMSIDQMTDSMLSCPKYSELQEALGLHITGHGQSKLDPGRIETDSFDCTGNFSYNRVTPSSDPNEHFIEGGDNGRNLLKAAGIDMAFNSKKRKHLADSTDHIGYKNSRLTLEDSIPLSSFTSASLDQENWTNSLLSPASCMTTEDHQQDKECNFVYHEKELKPPRSKKRRAGPALSHKSRPRDRQLLQDRLRELRELVPDGKNCSIDGLLDKTAKHLVFLKGVSDRSNKLREQSVEEVLAEGSRTGLESNQNGMSWAIEVGGEKNICPIIVKDLKIPRHMLIQIFCDDFVRFLEITEVIHQLELTVLRGVLDQQSDSKLANFIVEVPEKLHRLDIFWPLMQLVQSSVPAQEKN